MAIGKASDFKIYEEQFYGGMVERIAQNLAVFNAATAGAITLRSELLKGNFTQESFFKDIANLITRRDTTSTGSATDIAMTMGENATVKVNRKVGPVAMTRDAWRKIAQDPATMSLKLGQMIADKKLQDMVNASIASVEAAITAVTSHNVDKSAASPATLTHGYLVSALATFGDMGQNVVAWVMHSKPYYDLIGQAITDKIFGVANVSIMNGTVATLGRPTIVTDAPALLESGTPNKYPVLGLVAGAAECVESEAQDIVIQAVTGLEQLVDRLQGEYAFNLGVKGATWDITNGGVNPNDTALATSTNWDKTASDDKNTAGVRLLVQ